MSFSKQSKQQTTTYTDFRGHEVSVRKNGTRRVRIINTVPSMTNQDDKDSATIGSILEKFKRTGIMDNLRNDEPQYMDFSTALEFQDAQNLIAMGNSRFNALDASLRARFKNDPTQLLAFLENPDNRAEAVSLGLVNPPQAKKEPQGGEKPAADGSVKSDQSTSST